MKHFILSLILLSNIHFTNSTGMSPKSAKSAKSAKSGKSGKSSYTTTTTHHTDTDTYTSTTNCCDTTQSQNIENNEHFENYNSTQTSTSITSNILSTLISIPTITVPYSSTMTITTTSYETTNLEQNNSLSLGLNDSNSSIKMSAAIISIISLSTFIISAIFIITMLRRKKQQKDVNIIENQHYIGNISYEEPVPIIEQVIDSYYGTIEEQIVYENGEDEEGYLYALPQSDCEQTIFDESYESTPINQNKTQTQNSSNNLYDKALQENTLYDKATQEETLYDLGSNNYIYNEFC